MGGQIVNTAEILAQFRAEYLMDKLVEKLWGKLVEKFTKNVFRIQAKDKLEVYCVSGVICHFTCCIYLCFIAV